MHTKTLLLFVFLLTGMAFSQQGGTGRITFDQIANALVSPNEQILKRRLLSWGYDYSGVNVFEKGTENFRIVLDAASRKNSYMEMHPSIERCEEIRAQATKFGLKETQNYKNGYNVELEGNGFSVVILESSFIKITRVKK